MADENTLFPIGINAVVLDCPDVEALSDFYIRMLGWEKCPGATEGWVDIAVTADAKRGELRLAFQKNEDYVPPVWPEEPGKQQMMLHLDFLVPTRADIARAVEHAVTCGAVKAPVQYSNTWTVLFDPIGHPFCFVSQ